MSFPEKNQYQFINELGRGGTGVVNLAIDQHSGFPVAIKSLFDQHHTEDMINKFRIEANIYLMLAHPNIVGLKDFIMDNNGIHLVMEYIDGVTLDDYINNIVKGPVPIEVTLAMMKDVISAIGYAHNKQIPIDGYDGVLHLDIKPGNIIISKKGEIKIIDYGISQGNKEKRRTKIMCSLMYASPEQLDLDKTLDEKTDIYALGALFHEMVCGETPFDKTTTQEEMFEKVKEHPLRRIDEICSNIDHRIQKIIDKATHKNPNERYANCDEFINAIDKIS